VSGTVRVLIPFWTGVPAHCFYQEFQRGIGEAVRELGHEPVPFQFGTKCGSTEAEANGYFQLLQRVRIGVVLDLACWGCAFSGIWVPHEGPGRVPICDRFDVACVGWLFDHLHSQFIHRIHASRLYAAYPDLGQPEQARLIYPNLKTAGDIVAPPAVRAAADTSMEDWSKGRDIDVLYVGNLVPGALGRFWHDRSSSLWSHSQDPTFCDALAEAVLQEPETPLHVAMQKTIEKLGITPLGLHAQFSAVEHFLRFTVRRDAVVAVARSGVRMQVVGKGWDGIALPPNVEMRPEINYSEFFRLAGQAKICLDASTYVDGANDRVFTYAVNRAVCFTNSAGYLRATFGDDGGMRFYSTANLPGLCEGIRTLLSRRRLLCELGESAKQTVLSAHTWRHRLERILAAAAAPATATSSATP